MSISVSEILVVVVVALLVIKPENLPETASTLGKWFRWLRTTTQQIKQEWENPIKEISQEAPAKDDAHAANQPRE